MSAPPKHPGRIRQGPAEIGRRKPGYRRPGRGPFRVHADEAFCQGLPPALFQHGRRRTGYGGHRRGPGPGGQDPLCQHLCHVRHRPGLGADPPDHRLRQAQRQDRGQPRGHQRRRRRRLPPGRGGPGPDAHPPQHGGPGARGRAGNPGHGPLGRGLSRPGLYPHRAHALSGDL